MADIDTLTGEIASALRARGEPWAKQWKKPDGRADPEAVRILAQVGNGIARDSIHVPFPDALYLEQLGGWIADTVLVSPMNPKNVYRSQFQSTIRLAFSSRGAAKPSERVVDVLATLALGAYKETDLRAVRVGAPDLVVRMYLQGA